MKKRWSKSPTYNNKYFPLRDSVFPLVDYLDSYESRYIRYLNDAQAVSQEVP